VRRDRRFVVGLVLAAVGALLGLYGLFAILYGGDNGGSTYVTVFRHEIDARPLGAVVLLAGVVVITAAVFLMRERRRLE
jgi:divalent metal cation (Fe/Co/Zn/Cd) transporter